MSKHLLEQELQTQIQKENFDRCVGSLRKIQRMIKDRKKYMKARQEQITELEEIRAKLFKAYDESDQEMLEIIEFKLTQTENSSYRKTKTNDYN